MILIRRTKDSYPSPLLSLDRLLVSLIPLLFLVVACGASSTPTTSTLPANNTPTAAPATKPLSDPPKYSGPTNSDYDSNYGSESEYGSGGQSPATGEHPPRVEVHHDIMPTRNHVSEGQTVKYNSVPATSGDHWSQWSRCRFFEQELADERVVHNLEHGNIVVSYNLADGQDVNGLRDVMEGLDLSSIWGVTRAYDKIPEGSVALAAWSVSDTMQGIDRDRIRTFFENYAGKLGPERIPCRDSGMMP